MRVQKLSILFISFSFIFSFWSSAWAISFSDLSPALKVQLQRQKTVVIPVTLEDHLLKGAVFRWVPKRSPVELAAIFFDYDKQYLFLPGMTSTRVIEWKGAQARVRHRMNPMAFIIDQPPAYFHSSFFDFTAFSYDLYERVEQRDGAYLISWEMPPEARAHRSQEKGSILFESVGGGTLISYQNETEPFFYEALFGSQNISPVGQSMQAFFRQTAQQYYEKTIRYFLWYSDSLFKREGYVWKRVNRMLEVLERTPRIKGESSGLTERPGEEF
jgi:hypothetical protein